MPELTFVDWESRPAVMSGGSFAWAVLAPGEDWSKVEPAEVADSGRLLKSEEELRLTFSGTFGTLPSLPTVEDKGRSELETIRKAALTQPPGTTVTESPVRPLSEILSTMSAAEYRQLSMTGVALAHLDARAKQNAGRTRHHTPSTASNAPKLPASLVDRKYEGNADFSNRFTVEPAQYELDTKHRRNGRALFAGVGLTLVVFAYLAYMSLGIEVVSSMPSSAPLFFSNEHGTYASPPCVFDGLTEKNYISNLARVQSGQESIKLAPYVELVTNGMLDDLRAVLGSNQNDVRPDDKCRESGGFMQVHSWLLSALGLTKSRWAADGTWRW